jgi:hypothetical protein
LKKGAPECSEGVPAELEVVDPMLLKPIPVLSLKLVALDTCQRIRIVSTLCSSREPCTAISVQPH